MTQHLPDPEEPVAALHPEEDEEDSAPVVIDEEVPTEMVDAARQELEYPGDETDEG